MKRMAENAISYYNVTANDMKNITTDGPGTGTFTYTPSAEFIEAIHDFKCVLRVNWIEVAESISRLIGAEFTVLYPMNKVYITDEGDVAYSYSGGIANNNKQVNPTFFELNGKYKIAWDIIA